MSALSRGFFHLHTAYLAMQEMWRRSTLAAADDAQQRCLKARLAEIAASSYGKAVGVSPAMEYRDFARAVPVLSQARLRLLVEHMTAGEPGLLVPGQCTDFIRSSSAGTDSPLLLPFPQAQRTHLRRALQYAIGLFNARIANSGAWHGRCLFLDRPNLAKLGTTPGGDIPYSICTALHACMPATTRAAPPYRSLQARNGTSIVLASPERLLVDPLTNPAQDAPSGILPWPKLACWIHYGGHVHPYAAELRQRLGAKVPWHEIYGGALGLFAAQDRPGPGLRLLADTGIFFEFCKADESPDGKSGDSAARLIPLSRIETGVDYTLFVTTPSGLCRFSTGDVVRFIGLNPPRIIVQGKQDEVLDSCKEALRGRDCAVVLENIATKQGWSVVHFHVASSEQRSLVGQAQICHEWWIELQPGTAATPTGPVLSKLIDAELQILHPRYAERRNAGALQPPIVRLLMPGIFGEWLQSAHLFRAQAPACASDRNIADALAKIARFYA